MPRPSEIDTFAPPAGPVTSIAEKATVPPRQTPWFSRMKSAAALHDPKATVSFVVARDGETLPSAAFEPESLDKVRDDFTAGTVLQKRYRLIRELGRGGMGIVFLGRDQRLDRQVAVKVILSSGQSSNSTATMDSRQRSSFAEEARLGASLTHPAIATVFDYGFHHDNPFTVFEYIEGEPLRDLCERRGRLPLDEVRLIVGPLAQALDFAHGRRIVHRDLKPENIRATEQKQFKILDLGLAREFNRQEDWRFAGTPAYAAPEQAAELPSDGRADQYALAVIVFELLTGHRPFESNSWIDLLEMHYAEPPPSPRSLVPDLPQSVEDAILRSLQKDPNQRFSSCSELAVALGCQFLSGPAPVPEILLETEIKKMGGRWKTYLYPFSLRRPCTHLTLAPDALWAMHRAELMRWPLAALFDLRKVGYRKLSFRIRGVHGKDGQWFKFKNRQELRNWHESLESRLPAPEHAEPTDSQPPAQATAGLKSDLSVEPVVLLKSRPGTRFQLLGMAEAKAPNRRSAAAGLAIRGSMMGADAVVDLNQERLPGFLKTEHRASGMAVRAVDDEGRLELKTRWFSSQIGQVAIIMLVVASLELCIGALALFTMRSIGTLISMVAAICFVGLAAGLAFWKWPQLARPTAFCFLAKVVHTILGMLANAVGSAAVGFASFGALPASADRTTTVVSLGAIAAGAAAMLILSIFVAVSILVFFLYLGRRAWRIDQEYRSLARTTIEPTRMPASRRWISRLAWAAAIFYSSVLIGSSVLNLYGSVTAFSTMPKTIAVISSSTGAAVTADPSEWNAHAWKLATDSDPAARNPIEAVRLAEQTVAAGPTNADYVKTLGVARYRAGDFAGSIEALIRSIDTQGLGGDAAFFLAMAHARLGHPAEAQDWYRRADEWTRAKQPSDAALRRFRAEAAAVLDVADDKSAGIPPVAPAGPVAKDAARTTKPKS